MTIVENIIGGIDNSYKEIIFEYY